MNQSSRVGIGICMTTYHMGTGTEGTESAIAPPIFLKIGKIVSFSTPNISRLKEGATPKKVISTPTFYNFRQP